MSSAPLGPGDNFSAVSVQPKQQASLSGLVRMRAMADSIGSQDVGSDDAADHRTDKHETSRMQISS
jgi:hypothetical protein